MAASSRLSLAFPTAVSKVFRCPRQERAQHPRFLAVPGKLPLRVVQDFKSYRLILRVSGSQLPRTKSRLTRETRC